MIQVIKTGRNPTMRHLHRVHRISVAWLHERLGPVPERENVSVEYTASSDMCADIYTKHFTDPDAWKRVLGLINVIDPKSMQEEIGKRQVARRAAACASHFCAHASSPRPPCRSARSSVASPPSCLVCGGGPHRQELLLCHADPAPTSQGRGGCLVWHGATPPRT